MPDFDTVLHPDFLVPMMPRRQILTGHSVAVRSGQITAILPTPDARATDAREHIELPAALSCRGSSICIAMPPCIC